MRRLLSVFVGLTAWASLGAIETTTINGTINGADGTPATGGSIVCTLKPGIGRASDGSNTQVVLGPYRAVIGSGGTISFTLVPNDVITPSGTWYECVTTVTGANSTSSKETLLVASSPDPVTFGALQRTNTPALTLPSVNGAATTVATITGTGGIYGDGDLAWDATGNYLYSSVDLDGDGTAASADWNGDGTDDEKGLYSTEAIRARYFVGQRVAQTVDLDGNGTAYAPLNAMVEREAWARQHASLFGDPEQYLRPAVIDTYWSMMRGHPLIADINGDGTAGDPDSDGTNNIVPQLAIAQCSGNACSGDRAEICLSAGGTAVGSGFDFTADGTADLQVGDVIMITVPLPSSPDLDTRTHVITAIGTGAGTGTNCATSPANNMLTITPTVDQNLEGPDFNADGTADAAARVMRVWQNNVHPGPDAMWQMGAQIGYASRTLWGQHGPNLLRNGEADYTSTTAADNFTVSTANFGSQGFKLAPGNGFQCSEGTDGTDDCFYFTSTTNGSYIESTDWITVNPGDRLCASGLLMTRSGYSIGFAEDRNQDGTIEAPVSGLTYTFSASVFSNIVDNNYPQWFWACFDIPELSHRVKFRATKGDTTASFPLLDGLRVYKPSTYYADTMNANPRSISSFVINDPGDGLIILTGDSYFTATPGIGQYAEQGLEAALLARFGRSMTAQVIPTGKSGISAAGMLDTSTCTTTNSGGGSLNCWYDSIGQYAGRAAYVVVHLGVNDAIGSIGATAYVASMREIRNRIRAMGAIPVFITPEPINGSGSSPTGSGSSFDKVHQLRDALLRSFRNELP